MKSPEARYPHLLEPRSILGPRLLGALVTRGGARVAETLENCAAAVAATNIQERSTLVVVQGRPVHKPLQKLSGERQAERVLATAANIRAQQFAGDVAIMATVNAPGFEPTAEQRRKLAELDVRVIAQDAKATAADSINVALDEKPAGAEILVPVVAGNRFAGNQALRAASLRIGEDNMGLAAYGPRIMDMSAHPTKLAYTILGGDAEFFGQYADSDPHPSSKDNGFMSDAGAAVDLLSLDENRLVAPDQTHTGLDLWAAQNRVGGLEVWYDPALAVHDASAAYMSPASLIAETSHRDW